MRLSNKCSGNCITINQMTQSKVSERGNKVTKLSLYTDDTTAFIRNGSLAVSLFSLLEEFGSFSGLKINKSKTEGLLLGSWKIQLGKDEPVGISWPKQYVCTLGVVFVYERHVGDKINFDEQLDKLKKVSNLWSG